MNIENFPKNDKTKAIEQLKTRDRITNAGKVLRDFTKLSKEEKVLFVLDENPDNTDLEAINILKESLKSQDIDFNEIMINKKIKRKDFFKAVDQHDFIWDSADLDVPGFFYELADKLEEAGKRMAYCPGVRAEAFDNGGAMTEDKEEMDNRLDKMEAKLKDVAGLHVKSNYGSDLWVELRSHGERRWAKANGEIRPGGWDNLPGGEIFTTPDEEKVNGVLVLPVLQEQVTKDQGVDEFVRLTVRNGKIAAIDGGKSAEKLRKYLEKHSKKEEDPLSVVQFCEIAFGANSKSRTLVENPNKSYKHHMIEGTETEKRLGTIHLAFGSAEHGEEGAEGHTKSDVHLDFILPRNGLTVEGFKYHDDFKKRKNSERLIDEGRWKILE